MIFDLVKDFADVLSAMPAEHSRLRILKLLDEAIRRDADFLSRYPTTLFQCLWNSCAWYGNPKSERFIEILDSKLSPFGRPFEQDDVEEDDVDQSRVNETPIDSNTANKLHSIVRNWQNDKGRTSAGMYWLRSLWPPGVQLGQGIRAVLDAPGADFVRLAPNQRLLASCSTTGGVRLWDTASHRQIQDAQLLLPKGQITDEMFESQEFLQFDFQTIMEDICSINTFEWSPNSKSFSTGTNQGEILIWNREGGSPIRTLKPTGWIIAIDISPNDGHLAIAYADGLVVIRKEPLVSHHTESNSRLIPIPHIPWIEKGHSFGDRDQGLCWKLRGLKSFVSALEYSPCGRWLAVASENFLLVYACVSWGWDNEENGLEYRFEADITYIPSSAVDRPLEIEGDQSVCSVGWSPDGSLLATASHSGGFRILESETWTEIHRFDRDSDGRRTCCAWSPDGNHLVLGTDVGTLLLHSRISGSTTVIERAHDDAITGIAWIGRSNSFVTVSLDRMLSVWNSKDFQLGSRYRIASDQPLTCCHSTGDDSQRIAVAAAGTLQLWEFSSLDDVSPIGRMIEERDLDSETNEPIYHVVFRDQCWVCTGQTMVAHGTFDSTNTGRMLTGLQTENWNLIKQEITAMAWSPDGRQIAAGTKRGTVRLWDVESGFDELVSHTLGDEIEQILWPTESGVLYAKTAAAYPNPSRVYILSTEDLSLSGSIPDAESPGESSDSDGSEEILGVALVGEHRHLAVLDNDGLRIYADNWRQPQRRLRLSGGNNVSSASDGSMSAIVGHESVFGLSPGDDSKLHVIGRHPAAFNKYKGRIEFGPNGQVIYMYEPGGAPKIEVWDAQNYGSQIHTSRFAYSGYRRQILPTSTGESLLIKEERAFDYKMVSVKRVADGSRLLSSSGKIHDMVLSPDERFVLVIAFVQEHGFSWMQQDLTALESPERSYQFSDRHYYGMAELQNKLEPEHDNDVRRRISVAQTDRESARVLFRHDYGTPRYILRSMSDGAEVLSFPIDEIGSMIGFSFAREELISVDDDGAVHSWGIDQETLQPVGVLGTVPRDDLHWIRRMTENEVLARYSIRYPANSSENQGLDIVENTIRVVGLATGDTVIEMTYRELVGDGRGVGKYEDWSLSGRANLDEAVWHQFGMGRIRGVSALNSMSLISDLQNVEIAFANAHGQCALARQQPRLFVANDQEMHAFELLQFSDDDSAAPSDLS